MTPIKACCPQPTGYLPFVYISPSLQYIDPYTGVLTNVNSYMGLPISQTADTCLHVQPGGNVFDDSRIDVQPEDCPCCPEGYSYRLSGGVSNPSCYNWTLAVAVGGTGSGTFLVNYCNGTTSTVTLAQGTSLIVQALSGPSITGTPVGGSATTRRGSLANFDTGPGCYNVANDFVSTIPCIVCECPEPVPPPECITCTSEVTLPITFNFNENIKQCANCLPQGEPNLGRFKNFIADRLVDPIINFLRR